MAARLCPSCDELYPDVNALHNCPRCEGTPKTVYKPTAIPTIHLDEAERLVRLKENFPKFETWLKEHGRDGLEVPHVADVHSQRHHDYIDRSRAYRVINALEGSLVYGDTEPVFMGSVPYARRALPVHELWLA